MTAFDRFDRVFADVLADVAQPAFPDYIDEALDVATRKRQRPAWAFPERWLPMSALTRAVPFAPGLPVRRLLLAAILLMLIAGLALVAVGALRNTAPPYGLARNGLIAYEADGNLYTRDPADGAIVSVSTTNELDVYPNFARDGSKLAFLRVDPATADTANERATLYLSGLDGSPPRALLGPVRFHEIAWAPQGDRLAVVTEVSGQKELAILGLDGSKRVLNVEAEVLGWVAWRPPDGREIIFQGRKGALSFFAIKPDGTGFRRVPIVGTTIPPGGEIALTPDGRSVVYTWLDEPIDFRIADLDTGELRRFGGGLPVPEGGPGQGPMHHAMLQLSPDGTRVLIGRYWDGDQVNINHQVWVASLAGNGEDAVPVAPVIRSVGGQKPFLVQFSPDGTQILVHQFGTNHTWISDGDGAHRREVDWGQLYATDWQRLKP